MGLFKNRDGRQRAEGAMIIYLLLKSKANKRFREFYVDFFGEITNWTSILHGVENSGYFCHLDLNT